MKKVGLKLLLLLALDLVAAYRLQAASIDQLIAGAKKEGDIGFVAGAATFGNKKGLQSWKPPLTKNSVSRRGFN